MSEKRGNKNYKFVYALEEPGFTDGRKGKEYEFVGAGIRLPPNVGVAGYYCLGEGSDQSNYVGLIPRLAS